MVTEVIAPCKQYSHLSQSFKLGQLQGDLTLHHTISNLNDPGKEAFYKHWEKEKMWLNSFFP